MHDLLPPFVEAGGSPSGRRPAPTKNSGTRTRGPLISRPGSASKEQKQYFLVMVGVSKRSISPIGCRISAVHSTIGSFLSCFCGTEEALSTSSARFARLLAVGCSLLCKVDENEIGSALAGGTAMILDG